MVSTIYLWIFMVIWRMVYDCLTSLPLVIIHFRGIFPYKPSSELGVPPFWETTVLHLLARALLSIPSGRWITSQSNGKGKRKSGGTSRPVEFRWNSGERQNVPKSGNVENHEDQLWTKKNMVIPRNVLGFYRIFYCFTSPKNNKWGSLGMMMVIRKGCPTVITVGLLNIIGSWFPQVWGSVQWKWESHQHNQHTKFTGIEPATTTSTSKTVESRVWG